LRGLARPTVFGAILARESRSWWRDPRRRASIVSTLIASAVVPLGLYLAASRTSSTGVDLPAPGVVGAIATAFAVAIAGTLAGLVLANQFAFDGSAYAAHLLARVPGRTELRARLAALAVVVLPLPVVEFTVISLVVGRPGQVPATLGELAAVFAAATTSSALVSVFVPFALPESSNPFALNAGGGTMKGLFAVVSMLATFVLAAPLLVLGVLVGGAMPGSLIVLAAGLAYGGLLIWLGTALGGAGVDRRGPEILQAVSPRR
jgi:ABC-2 type transport system permease protein